MRGNQTSPSQALGTLLLLETGNWTMNATVQTNHTFVGAIPLHVQVKACIEMEVCGKYSDAVSVPLVHAMSQPSPPLLKNQADSYAKVQKQKK